MLTRSVSHIPLVFYFHEPTGYTQHPNGNIPVCTQSSASRHGHFPRMLCNAFQPIPSPSPTPPNALFPPFQPHLRPFYLSNEQHCLAPPIPPPPFCPTHPSASLFALPLTRAMKVRRAPRNRTPTQRRLSTLALSLPLGHRRDTGNPSYPRGGLVGLLGGILRFLLPQPFIRQGAPHSEKGAVERAFYLLY